MVYAPAGVRLARDQRLHKTHKSEHQLIRRWSPFIEDSFRLVSTERYATCYLRLVAVIRPERPKKSYDARELIFGTELLDIRANAISRSL